MLVLGDRYVRGGDAEGARGRINLHDFLALRFDFDAHVTQYVNAADVRLTKLDHADVPLAFHVLLFDVDRVAGQPAEAPAVYFDFLVYHLAVWLAPRPNFVYGTRNGIRIGYVLKAPITDRKEFEAKYRRLWNRINDEIHSASHAPYFLDPATRDWTRLFRGRDVVRTDKPYDGRDAPLCIAHPKPLDPARMAVEKPKPRRKRKVVEVQGDAGLYVKTFERKHLGEGERNAALNRAVFVLYRYYGEAEADAVADRLIDHAVDSGLPRSEAESTAAGAKRRGMRAREVGAE